MNLKNFFLAGTALSLLLFLSFSFRAQKNHDQEDAACQVDCTHGSCSVEGSGNVSCTCSWWGIPTCSVEQNAGSIIKMSSKQEQASQALLEASKNWKQGQAEKDFLQSLELLFQALKAGDAQAYEAELGKNQELLQKTSSEFQGSLRSFLYKK